jgi:surface antigen
MHCWANRPEVRTMRCRSLLLLCLVAIALPVAASAQINPFRGGRGTPLNAEDLKALQDATKQLLDSQQVSVGSTESWNNTKSGIAGTVTAGSTLQRHGLACRRTSYQLTGPGAEPDRKAALVWCKSKTGWKIG